MYDNKNALKPSDSAIATNGRNYIISHLFYVRGMEATLQKLNNDFANLNNQIKNCENYIKKHPVKANQRSRKDYDEKPHKNAYFNGISNFFFGFIERGWFAGLGLVIITIITIIVSYLIRYGWHGIIDMIAYTIGFGWFSKVIIADVIFLIIIDTINYFIEHKREKREYKLALEKYKEHKKEVDEYNSNLGKYNANDLSRVEREKGEIAGIRSKINGYKQQQNVISKKYWLVKRELDKIYEQANIIPFDKRNMYCVYYLYNYMTTSTESFTSALLHCDLNTIKSQLGTVIQNQIVTICNQWKMQNTLEDIQSDIEAESIRRAMSEQEIMNRLDNISNGQDVLVNQASRTAAAAEQTAEISRVAAANAESRFWLAYAKYLN